MKKALTIGSLFFAVSFIGVALIISFPSTSSALVYEGEREGNRCTITVGDDSWDKPCGTLWTENSDIGGVLGSGSMTCNVDGTCKYETSSGSYGGTVTNDYLSTAQANSILNIGGLTDPQINAVNGVFQACQNMIAARGGVITYPASGTSVSLPVSNALRRGSVGTEVVGLQQFLNNLGYNITVDGKFGAGTETALKSWQAANGLTADGVYGSTSRTRVNMQLMAAPATATVQQQATTTTTPAAVQTVPTPVPAVTTPQQTVPIITIPASATPSSSRSPLQ